MILLYDYQLCFLRKPKCGTSSMLEALHKSGVTKQRAFVSERFLSSCHNNYHDIHYQHNNLDSAIAYLKYLRENIDDWIFIGTQRDPIQLFKSLYFFDIHIKRKPAINNYHMFSNHEEMRRTIHYKMFTDRVFWNNYENVNLKLFKLEEIHTLADFLDKDYNINITFPRINVHKDRENKDIDVSNIKTQIYEDFYLYNKL